MIGGAREKIQTIIELAEEVYERVNEVYDQLQRVRDTVEDTQDRVEAIEAELRAHRVVLEAIADDHDIEIDLEAIEATDPADDPE